MASWKDTTMDMSEDEDFVITKSKKRNPKNTKNLKGMKVKPKGKLFREFLREMGNDGLLGTDKDSDNDSESEYDINFPKLGN